MDFSTFLERQNISLFGLKLVCNAVNIAFFNAKAVLGHLSSPKLIMNSRFHVVELGAQTVVELGAVIEMGYLSWIT